MIAYLAYTHRTLQHRHERFLPQRHDLESLFVDCRSKCFFLGPTVITLPLSSITLQTKSFSDSVGVGFSYADHGETVETTEDAAKNVHAFISIFFETFKGFTGRPFHLSGESYGVCLFFSLSLNIKKSNPIYRDDIYQCLQARYMTRTKSLYERDVQLSI